MKSQKERKIRYTDEIKDSTPEELSLYIKYIRLLITNPTSFSLEKLVDELSREPCGHSTPTGWSRLSDIMDKLVYLSECMEAIENYCRQEYNESIDRLNKIKSNRQKSKKLREVCDEARKKIEEDIDLYLRIAVRAVEETSDRKHDKQNPETLTLYKIEKELKKMSEASKYQIKSEVTIIIEENKGEVIGKKCANDPAFIEAVTEMVAILIELQQKYPSATEAEAQEIIEAEFAEIRTKQPTKWQTFRQQLLNRERWFNGGKAALSETAKHYVDNNVFYKVGLAFLDGFSADEE